MASGDSGDRSDYDWDPDKMLRLYLHDYLLKRGMNDTAEIFKNEAQIGPNPRVEIKEPPGGFLHEWWSIFYEVFASRQLVKDPETGPGSSSKVPKITDNARNNHIPPMMPPQFQVNTSSNQITAQPDDSLIPSTILRGLGYLVKDVEPRNNNYTPPMMPQQIQNNSSFNQIMEQPATCLVPSTSRVHSREHLGYLVEDVEPSLRDLFIANNLKTFLAGNSSNHPPEGVGNKARQQVLKDNGNGIRLGNDVPRYALDVVHRRTQSLDGPYETKTNEALNMVPLNGRPVNNLALITPLLQEPDFRQLRQVLKTQNQEPVPAQVLASTPKRQTFAVPRNPTECSSQYLQIPRTPSNEDRQMMDQMIRTVEHQNQQDQTLQMQSQNVENVRKRKKTVSLRPGENALDCVGAANGKPVDENVESFLSFENEHDHRNVPFSNLKRISSRNENKGFSFEEVGSLHTSQNKVLSTHFSSNGKILASAGHEKKVFIWNIETFDCVTTEEAHSLLITDVRFRPDSTIFATSSFDRSVRLWDAARPTRSLFKLTGHAEQVMSLDFHPKEADLLCSCDSNDVIRLWNITKRACTNITTGGSKQVRFQPRLGNFLAAATGNDIKITDFETDSLLYHLKGHVKDVHSICWDGNGDYIASVSEDSARVWSVSDGKCINELHSNGNKFQSCIFHPAYLNLLVIGGYQTLELWNPTEGSKTYAVPAHKGLIAGLADSSEDESVASASHDHSVKLWK